MLRVLEVTLPVFALVFCGFFGQRGGLLPAQAVQGLNAFVFYFALPAMLFRVIATQRGSGSPELYPRRDTRFQAGDTAYLVGPYHDLLTVLRKGQSGHPRKAHPPRTVTEGLGLSDGLN